MQGTEQVAHRLAIDPPTRADLRVRPPVDATLSLVRSTQGPVVAQVAVVAEREAPGRVVERLRVGSSVDAAFDGRRRWTRAAVVVTAPTRAWPSGSSRNARTSR